MAEEPGPELGEVPAPRLRLTGEGTLIMSVVPLPGARDGAAPGGDPGPQPGPGYKLANPREPGGS